MTDPLYPHLLDLLADPIPAGGLILAGGYGLRLRQQALQEQGVQTLLAPMPDARATMDLDFLLRLECFIADERARAVRQRLDELGYEVVAKHFQFSKPLAAEAPGRQVKVDLLARLPEPDEASSLRVRPPRVQPRSSVGLHGRATPEAFAVEDSPTRWAVAGEQSDGTPFAGEIQTPNVYAWLNLKVAAAGDWLRARLGGHGEEDASARHVFDVLVLVASLTEAELPLCQALRDRYHAHPKAGPPRQDARDLFGSSSAPGSRELLVRTGHFDYATFREALREILGVV
jgi:hypothetical protein